MLDSIRRTNNGLQGNVEREGRSIGASCRRFAGCPERRDRIARNTVNETDPHKDGIGFRSLTDQIDTTTPAGRFFFNIMASLAQMERELTIERTQAGLAAARAKGRLPGRKRIMTDSKIASTKKLLADGTRPADLGRDLGVSLPTLYRWIPAHQQ